MAKEFPTADSITKDAAQKLRQIADRLDTLVIDELKAASYSLPRIAKVLGDLDTLVDGGPFDQMASAIDQADRFPSGQF